MFAPRDKILQPVVKFRLYYALAGIFCIFFILALIRFMGGKIVRAITQLSSATSKVAGGEYGKNLQVKSKDEIGQLVKNFNAMVAGLKERDFVRNTFGRYVDKEIAKQLLKGPAATRLGGERRQVAILISDIRDFTVLSEDLNPDGTITILNHYFSHMIGVIRKNQGIIIDFVGDGILAFFDPFDRPVKTAIFRAVQCALDMQAEMKAFNEEMRDVSLPTLEMGVAVNAGEVVVGNIGSEDRAKYGIVGSAVNVTQRIQSFAEGDEVIVSESVHKDLPGGISVIRSFTTKLKGLSEAVKLYVIKTKTDPQTHSVDLKEGL
jgi:class 3 adenylate cyclase